MLESLRNEILFSIRRALPRLRAKPYSESLEPGIRVESGLPFEVASGFNEKNLRLVEFYLWILNQVPWTPKNGAIRSSVIDIGAMNFMYAPALAKWLQDRAPAFELTGLELDPYRMYSNFYRRGDCAAYYMGLARSFLNAGESVDYREGDWLKWDPETRYDLITCFFPFLFDDLHDRFGLPRKHFAPEDFYRKCFQQSDSVLFFHQGETERDESLKIIKKLDMGAVQFQKSFHENPWLKRKHSVEAILWNHY